ncbi:MAG: hypothetical protein IT353_21635 [Gemmatimonadaceae bacterium]|nr:hypothetical protein [Gemmatimonadaceae bacterium]
MPRPLALSITAFALFLPTMPVGAQPVPARRIVRETAAVYQRAPQFVLIQTNVWCADASAAGCDFRGPASVRATPSGGLLASDFMGPLRLFDSTGALVRELGRKGQGPGEYGFVVDAHVASDGFVTWFDNTQMRFASVRLDGQPGPTRRLLPPPTMANLFVVDTQLVILDVPAHTVIGTPVDASYRTVPVAGAPRVIARVRTPAVFASQSNMTSPPPPFAPRVQSDVGAAFDVAHSSGDRYAVDVFPSTGAPWSLLVDYPSRAVTAAERDSAIAAGLTRYRVKRVADLPPPLRVSYEQIPAVQSPITRVKVLNDGTVWIRPVPPAGATDARWDGFRRDGTRLGQIHLPFNARIWDGAATWIVITATNAEDVPSFTRYRLQRSPLAPGR